jgi:hypothetical protein
LCEDCDKAGIGRRQAGSVQTEPATYLCAQSSLFLSISSAEPVRTKIEDPLSRENLPSVRMDWQLSHGGRGQDMRFRLGISSTVSGTERTVL